MPQYMPMSPYVKDEWKDEEPEDLGNGQFGGDYGYLPTDNNYVDYQIWGRFGAEWMPLPSATQGEDIDDSNIEKYFYYAQKDIEARGEDSPYYGMQRPQVATGWTYDRINQWWEASHVDTDETRLTFYGDFDDDGDYEYKYMYRKDLKKELRDDIQSGYKNEYCYTCIHGEDGSQNPDTPSFAHDVLKKHIYNTAVVTPYNTNGYVLERWGPYGSTRRVINGSFLKMPDSAQRDLPEYAGRYRTKGSHYSSYVYETRLRSDKPPADLTGGKHISWRIVDNDAFNIE